MKYAIVDIETTGGYAHAHGITEIGIVIHNGLKITDSYSTLINPQQPIPWFIQRLTGITDVMVDKAPLFSEVAATIYSYLKGAVFVAHNVNFDYSFVNYFLAQNGYDLKCSKLCTVRLARKILPGYPSYSLGKLCKQLDIKIEGRHRALGDATATATLFDLMLKNDESGYIKQSLKKTSREQTLPPNLSEKYLVNLPDKPGVYYFLDKQRKVIYVGKAKNLRKRVISHFSNNAIHKQKQDFLRSIYHLETEVCATELMAIVLESAEIKRLWPAFNRSQKKYEPVFAIYDYEDQNGYLRLFIDKVKTFIKPLATFKLHSDALDYLHKIVGQYDLCPKLSGLQNSSLPCIGFEKNMCKGACAGIETSADYNQRLQLLIDEIDEQKPTFAVKQTGRNAEEQAVLLVEKGKLYGMGYISNHTHIAGIEDLKSHLKPIKENFHIRFVIAKFAQENPSLVWQLKTTDF
ncbi:MAG: GIY-YIG nuclease family protein [Bacteroidia bacterium]|nr:GIY-YIG nuclease family protein [Bacteroidia bacterium]